MSITWILHPLKSAIPIAILIATLFEQILCELKQPERDCEVKQPDLQLATYRPEERQQRQQSTITTTRTPYILYSIQQ